jgi:hypothetical protein
MNTERTIELFVLKCASLQLELDAVLERHVHFSLARKIEGEASLGPFISQFPLETRRHATDMAEYYKIFYMLENDIRRLIEDTLSEAHGPNWWIERTPDDIQQECRKNQQRELDAGITSRSENPLDYVTFGQLGELIRTN